MTVLTTHPALDDGARTPRASLGGWLARPTPDAIGAFAAAGLDFAAIDLQHSRISESDAQGLLEVALRVGIPAITRVGRNDPARIGKMLDSGASAVIVPMVETVQQAEAAVAACRFPPHGVRSFGPIRDDLQSLPLAELDRRARCLVQIETALGLENVAPITAVDGLDGIYVGPCDLSISLGLDPAGAFHSDQLKAPFAELHHWCARRGIVLGTHAVDADSARRFLSWGATLLPVTSDLALLRSGARQALAEVTGSTLQTGPGAY